MASFHRLRDVIDLASNGLSERLREQLKSIQYPGLNRDIVSFGFVEELSVDDGNVTVQFDPSTDREDLVDQMVEEIKQKLGEMDEVRSVTVDVRTEEDGSPADEGSNEEGNGGGNRVAAAAPGATTSPGEGPVDRQPIEGVQNIVAVASGKGGVGKSTVAVNLAAALSERGHSVGMADMDIYGPSAPTMMGIADRPKINEQEKILPLEAHGLKVMSIGFVLDATEPVVWRGPMVMKAVEQFLRDVAWGELDYIVVDLPPGTGDAQLTLMQKVPLSGAVIVTTPQDVALIDAQKSVEMFRKMDTPILGIAENMSFHTCPECGHESEIFGAGGGRKEALRLDVPFLGGLPLDSRLREDGDAGVPTVLNHPDCRATEIFFSMAESVESSAKPVPSVLQDASG